MAELQTAAIARLITHAIELTQDAGCGRARIETRLGALVQGTTIERIQASGAGGEPVYEAAAPGVDCQRRRKIRQ